MSEPKYGTLDPNDLISSVRSIIGRLESLAQPASLAQPGSFGHAYTAYASASTTDESIRTLADGLTAVLRTSLATLSAVMSIGECRKDVPYSPLHPIIDSDGTFKWCCNHDPEHCGK
jgi:hypothetical protein